jgi:hypothetical protein
VTPAFAYETAANSTSNAPAKCNFILCLLILGVARRRPEGCLLSLSKTLPGQAHYNRYLGHRSTDLTTIFVALRRPYVASAQWEGWKAKKDQ